MRDPRKEPRDNDTLIVGQLVTVVRRKSLYGHTNIHYIVVTDRPDVERSANIKEWVELYKDATIIALEGKRLTDKEDKQLNGGK